nr:hypothetical protein [Tanacetum cinerariifolium]
MLVPQQVNDDVADVATDDVVDEVTVVVAKDVAEPTPPLPTPAITPPPPQELLFTKVEALEQDKIAQAFKITKLKQKVRKLEKKSKLKVSGRMHPNRREIAKLNANEDVTLEEVYVVTKGAEDDEPKPVELKEVIEVVTTAKLMTEIVTTAATTITAAPSDVMRRKGVVIRDPEETANPSTIVHSEPKSRDKGKGILVKEPKPLKKQAQIEQDEAYARDFGVDAVEDFKEYMLRDYYCWLKTYCCWYKLKLLDNAANLRLRLLKESAAADDKMKK